ncbi:MAG: GreA/GreB family elongation factor [Flavobacteriales bacterium]
MNKTNLLQHCLKQIEETIRDINNQIQELVTDAANDSKSTAGDKHETGRAMMQLAREQLGKQLQEAEFKRNQLMRMDVTERHTRVTEGSIISTNENTLFLAAPIGKIQFNGADVFVISTQSPLGKILLGKAEGETVTFNQRNITILQVQ